MKFCSNRRLRSATIVFIALAVGIATFAQNVANFSDIVGGSSVFVFIGSQKSPGVRRGNAEQQARLKKRRPLATAKPRNSATSAVPGPGAKVLDEPIAPDEWINEQADFAIEERKIADDEPMLSLTEGFLNSRINGCTAPVFPAAARKAKLQSVRLRLSITVAKYGGVLDAKVIDGDAIFRKAVYDSLGSMRFRQSYFMGEPVRIQAIVEFTQHNSDSYNLISCRDAVKEAELPAVIDGDVISDRSLTCESPQFPADAKKARLKSVEARVEVIVDERGKVSYAKLIDGHPAFGEAAVKTAMKATFRKSTIVNTLVKVRGVLEFRQTVDNNVQCQTIEPSQYSRNITQEAEEFSPATNGGRMNADVVAIIGSLDIVLGEIDK